MDVFNGGDVFLDVFQVTVNTNSGAGLFGKTVVGGSGPGSRMVVGSGTLDTDLLTIDSGGSIGVTGGLVQVDVGARIAAGGTFSGRGTLQFAGRNGGLTNFGTVRTHGGDLVIERIGGGGDFEQNGGALTADVGDWLRVNMPTIINGGTTTVSPDATLRFDQSTTVNGGTINVDGTVEFNQSTTLNGGAFNVGTDGDVSLVGPTTWAGVSGNNTAGPKTGIIRQNGNATVTSNTTIGSRVYDFDGGVNFDPSITIQSGATLQLNVEFIDTDSTGTDDNDGYEGTVTIEDNARLDVNNASGEWFSGLGGTITLQGMPVAEPQAVVAGTADITSTGGGANPPGLIEGNGTFEVNVNSGGIIRPGLSEGVLNFKEDLTLQSAGTLEIKLQNAPANTFDQIFVGGDAMLGGTLDVTLQSFIESDGLEFEIINVAGTRSGMFDGLGEGSYVGTNGKDVYITYHGGDGNDVVLFTSPGVPGDYNKNGKVENADLTLLLNNWAATVPPTPAGWIGTPLTAPAVDNDELTALLNNWGTTASNVGNAIATPEPGSVVLLSVLSGIVLLARRSNRNQRLFLRFAGNLVGTVR